MLGHVIRASKNKYFTFIVVPHNSSGGTYSFRVPAFVVYSLILVILFCGTLVASSVVYTSALSRKLLHYQTTLQVNEEQKKQIDYFTSQTQLVKKAISELIDRDNELRRMLGIRVEKPKVDLSAVVASDSRLKLSDLDSNTAAKISKVSDDLGIVDKGLKERDESLGSLMDKVKDIKTRFAHTPSIWPLYGRIVSGFGYRYMPWRGFHTGTDIATWYGAPIRATADGVVTYAGWRGGYGKALLIDHGYGVVTLYGHNSKLAVSLGSRVKKGQIVAYVGATGLATGPHVHYEIRKNGYLANPIGYLNLDIFTASKAWNKQ